MSKRLPKGAISPRKTGPNPGRGSGRLASPQERPAALEAASWGLVERALQELTRYYRHSAAGRRCHGMIHNLNAPLQVLSFHMELLEHQLAEEKKFLAAGSDEARQKLAVLHRQRQKRLKQMQQGLSDLQILISRLIQQGLHEDLDDRLSLDLNELYRNELALYHDNLFFKHHVQKEFWLLDNLPPIYGYYIDFSQSFRNIVDNALEALEGAKTRRLVVRTEFDGQNRVIKVGDTGGGIPPDMAKRIFEPFFTTKGTPEKPRAGLGLYMARHLLAPYRGQIRVASQAGETWVTIILPAS